MQVMRMASDPDEFSYALPSTCSADVCSAGFGESGLQGCASSLDCSVDWRGVAVIGLVESTSARSSDCSVGGRGVSDSSTSNRSIGVDPDAIVESASESSGHGNIVCWVVSLTAAWEAGGCRSTRRLRFSHCQWFGTIKRYKKGQGASQRRRKDLSLMGQIRRISRGRKKKLLYAVGLVRTVGSTDGTETGRDLSLDARTTNGRLACVDTCCGWRERPRRKTLAALFSDVACAGHST